MHKDHRASGGGCVIIEAGKLGNHNSIEAFIISDTSSDAKLTTDYETDFPDLDRPRKISMERCKINLQHLLRFWYSIFFLFLEVIDVCACLHDPTIPT
jgi:hypothetical protein